jgi:hypothetical protein
MPAYIVKVTLEDGSLRPPIVANCSSEDEAIELVKLMVDATKIEVEGIRDDGMKAAFGDMPEGSAVFRNDWTWSLDGEKPVPQ